MWKRKKCGCSEVFRPISGKFTGIENDFDEKGISGYTSEVVSETTSTEFFECHNCCESARYIDDVAEWINEDN